MKKVRETLVYVLSLEKILRTARLRAHSPDGIRSVVRTEHSDALFQP